MCGICGKLCFDPAETVRPELLKAMCDIMVHRGPDDEGYYQAGPAGLGIRRLSIIDVSGGHQPISNEEGSVWIVCNGEIYNFPELREGLAKLGHRFKTKSDVEAIVHLYEEHGEDCLKYLGGMFAFSLWDQKKRKLLLGRDRLGKKPLFYALTNGGLIFASSLKSILKDPDVKRDINIESIHHYLTYQYIPEPETIWQQIKKLPPAHFLVCEEGKVRIERYWDLKFGEKLNLSEAEAQEQVYESVREATKARLVSDVPLGAFLSGGIDSTVVVGFMSQLMSRPVKTFSIGFEEVGFSELAYARIAAKHFGTEHHEFKVKPNAIEVLPDLVWHFEEPMADSSGIPTYYLSKMTRQYVTVALNGDGGDETFAGYERYLAFLLANYYYLIPKSFREKVILPLVEKLSESPQRRSFSRRLKRFARAVSLPKEDRYAKWMTIFDDGLKDFVYSEEMKRKVGHLHSLDYLRKAYRKSDAPNDLDRLLYVDTVTYLPGDLLVKMDRTCMAHSLEGRSPFLDHKVMELAAGLPAKMKLKGSVSKYILKQATSKMLPREILNRGKQGFGVPLGAWFREELKALTSRILFDSRTQARGYFDPNKVRALLDEHQTRRADHSHRIWALLILELWHRTFIDNSQLTGPVQLF